MYVPQDSENSLFFFKLTAPLFSGPRARPFPATHLSPSQNFPPSLAVRCLASKQLFLPNHLPALNPHSSTLPTTQPPPPTLPEYSIHQNGVAAAGGRSY